MHRASRYLLISSLTLGGCAAKLVDWQATGGSRADGTVRLSYQNKDGRNVYTDPAQGARVAKARCAAWGYQDAEPFGLETTSCDLKLLGMCGAWTVTREYQCLGSLAK